LDEAITVSVEVSEGLLDIEIGSCPKTSSQHLTRSLAFEHGGPEVAELSAGVGIEVLRWGHSSGHVEVWPISEEGSVLLAHG